MQVHFKKSDLIKNLDHAHPGNDGCMFMVGIRILLASNL